MKLLVEELKTTLYQKITLGKFNQEVAAIRPHLLIFNKPGMTGTLKVQIQDENGGLIAESESLNIDSLSTLNYAHKYYRFYIKASLMKLTTYRVALIAGGGYAFSESAYIGWCNGWEFRRNESYVVHSDLEYPLDFELWDKKQVKRGLA